MTEKKKALLIFCDPGLDDALAILWLLAADYFMIKGLIAVAGNTTAEQALKNLFALTRIAGKKNIPIYSTMQVHQSYHLLPQVHGKNGLGDISFSPSKQSCQPTNIHGNLRLTDRAIKKLTIDPDYQVLSLGPLTVVAQFIEKALNPPKKIMIMGGLEKATGNNNSSEFNFSLDHKAAKLAIQYENSRVAVVPLDLTKQFSLRESFINRLPEDNQASQTFRDIAKTYLLLAHKRGDSRAYPHDLTAAVATAKPAIFKQRRGLLKMKGPALELEKGNKDIIFDSLAVSEAEFESAIEEVFYE